MTKLSELAITECVLELKAACRRPIDAVALDTVIGWVRPDFERILDRLDGKNRWADVGPRVREIGRHVGGFADFFASHAGSASVGVEEMTQAVTLARADCTVRAEKTPVAWEFCPETPVNARAAEAFLRAMAPEPALMSRAS